jgi:outer membrane protein OmpA-like peptidoglycan-associated protein
MIQFDFDSARLQEASKPLLNSLAQAFKTDQLRSFTFSIEGHTDARGTAEYNQKLSLRRADAVVTYLRSRGIEQSRLSPQGKGFNELLLPQAPLDEANRRVRITTQIM